MKVRRTFRSRPGGAVAVTALEPVDLAEDDERGRGELATVGVVHQLVVPLGPKLQPDSSPLSDPDRPGYQGTIDILASMPRSRCVETFRLAMAAGFETVVRRAAESDVEGVTVVAEQSGLITLRGPAEAAAPLAKAPYASMVLLELGRTSEGTLDDAAASLAAQLAGRAASEELDLRRGFRIRVSDAGALVRIDAAARKALERAVTRWSGAFPSARGGGLELWVVRRRGDRRVTLSLRLDSAPVEKPERGELKQDLAAALVRTVPLSADDVYFDPFAGSGAIARARARYQHSEVFASDASPEAVDRLTRLLRRGELGARAHVACLDVGATNEVREFVGGGRVSMVVTDPPWGVFTGDLDEVKRLYRRAASTLQSVVAPDGRVVVLTAAADAAEAALASEGFALAENFGVLVNGRKARVVVAHA